jgi:hypothetical protein
MRFARQDNYVVDRLFSGINLRHLFGKESEYSSLDSYAYLDPLRLAKTLILKQYKDKASLYRPFGPFPHSRSPPFGKLPKDFTYNKHN